MNRSVSDLMCDPAPGIEVGESAQPTEWNDHCRQLGRSLLVDDRQGNSRGVELCTHENELLLLDAAACQLTVAYPLPRLSGHGHLSYQCKNHAHK